MELPDVGLEGEVRAVTDKAILVEIDGDEEWIPKSQIIDCDEDVDGIIEGDFVKFSIPGWLAEAKGLD